LVPLIVALAMVFTWIAFSSLSSLVDRPRHHLAGGHAPRERGLHYFAFLRIHM